MSNRSAIILMLVLGAAISGLFYAYWLHENTPEAIARAKASTARAIDSHDQAMCAETAEAAHYIAAKSGGVGGVNKVVNDVVADRKYPIIGDKVVASIGLVVITEYGTKTPDEIAAQLRDTCLKRLAGGK